GSTIITTRPISSPARTVPGCLEPHSSVHAKVSHSSMNSREPRTRGSVGNRLIMSAHPLEGVDDAAGLGVRGDGVELLVPHDEIGGGTVGDPEQRAGEDGHQE